MNLREFAKVIGLSVSTVSRALNGYSDVNEETRRRVIQAAAEFGYAAEPAARRLRKRSSGLVAFILSPPQKHFANPFFLDMIAGINERLKTTELQLIVASAASYADELDTLKRLVEQQRVDGVIFARTRRFDDRIDYLQSRGVPFVTHGRSENQDPFAFLDIDHEIVGKEGCARFIALGHRRIALLNTPSELMYSHHRRAGYEAALRAAGIPVDPELIIEQDFTEEGGTAGVRRLFSLKDPPSAILCGHDWAAIGALRAVAEFDKTPGLDVGIIGSDDNPFGHLIWPPLTTFTAPRVPAGNRLAELLLASMSGTPVTELQELWKPELVIRASDGPPRGERVPAIKGGMLRNRPKLLKPRSTLRKRPGCNQSGR